MSVSKSTLFRLSLLIGTTPSELRQRLTADELAAWIKYLEAQQ